MKFSFYTNQEKHKFQNNYKLLYIISSFQKLFLYAIDKYNKYGSELNNMSPS